MKEIKLTKGYVALVDDEDYDNLSRYKWHAHFYKLKNKVLVYARRSSWKNKPIYMHREILGISNEKKLLCDHVDQNTLNNVRSNLRVATKAQNQRNQRGNENRLFSRYKGVTFNRRQNSWFSQINGYGKYKFLGYFDDEESAAFAYNQAASQLFGEFALLNKLPENFIGKQKRTLNKSSKYRGVYYDPRMAKKWKMSFSFKGERKHKYYDTEIDAAKAYDLLIKTYRTDTTKLNFHDASST